MSLPDLEEERFKEAVIFNTQMVAPLPLEEVYFDWEDWGESVKENEREVFIALGVKKQIDPYLEILNNTGFKIVAVEPWALSLVRFLTTFGEKEQAVLSVSLRTEGIEFILSENNKLIFFDFDSWPEIFGNNIPKQITLEMIKKHLDGEIPMLLNFYFLKRKKPVQKFIFLSTNNQFVNLISQFLKETYHLEPFTLTLPSYLKWVTLDWFSAIGAALRGLIPRYQDTIVSLAPVGTEQSYEQNHLYRVVSLWSKISLTIVITLVGMFGLLDFSFFQNIKTRYSQLGAKPTEQSLIEKKNLLSQQADEFNALVALLGKIQSLKQDDVTILQDLFHSSQVYQISINRILISNAPANNLTLQGQAKNQEAVFNWRSNLEKNGVLKEITIPLETLVETSEGVSFTLNAKI